MSTPISHFGLVLKSPNVIFSSLRTSQKTISCAIEWSAHFRPPLGWFVGFLMAVGSKCARVCEEIPQGINTRCIKRRVGNENKIETLLFRCKIKILFWQMRDFQTLGTPRWLFFTVLPSAAGWAGGSDRHNLHWARPALLFTLKPD